MRFSLAEFLGMERTLKMPNEFKWSNSQRRQLKIYRVDKSFLLGHLRRNEEMRKLVWGQEDSPMSKRYAFLITSKHPVMQMKFICIAPSKSLHSRPPFFFHREEEILGGILLGKGQEYPPSHWVSHSGYAMTKIESNLPQPRFVM